MARGRGPLIVLFLTVFMDLVGFGIVIPLLPLYADEWGASHWVNGLLLASYSLMQFLFAPLWGRLSDRVGRRPVILVSLTGSTVSYVLFAVAGLQTSMLLLFISRILAGVMGANIPVAQAYIADVTKPEERAHGMGLIGAAFGLGFILGPAFAGLAVKFGPAGPGAVAALICGVNLLLAFVRLPESFPPERRGGARASTGRARNFISALSVPGVRRLISMFFIFTVAISIWETTLPTFGKERFKWGEEIIPWVFVYAGVMMAVAQGYLVRRLRRRVSEAHLILAGTATAATGFVLLALIFQPALHFVALAIFCVGGGIASPALLGLVSRSTDARVQGSVLGVSQSLSSLARVIGPLLGYGLLEALHRESLPFFLAAVLTGSVMVAALTLPKVEDRDDSDSELRA